MEFKEYLNNLYITLLIPNDFYNNIDLNNKDKFNYKKIKLSIIPISYDNLTSDDIINLKKENIIPLIIECNNIFFKQYLNYILKENAMNNIIKISLEPNLNKIIYFVKYLNDYNYFVNSIMILFPIFNKLCECLYNDYLRYPIINISSFNEKLNILFLKSRKQYDKDKYFYNCKYNNGNLEIIYKIYYNEIFNNINIYDLFNRIN